MGNFYINIAVKGISTAALRKKMAAFPFPSIITPEIEGHSFVYGDFFGAGDMQAPGRLARTMSQEIGVEYSVCSMNADDDLLVCEFWKNGAPLDAYYSNPEAFQPDERYSVSPRGDPKVLKSAFPFLDEQETRRVLDSDDYVFAFERHQELFRLLRIPIGPAIMDFHYLQNGEVPEGVEEASLIRIGS